MRLLSTSLICIVLVAAAYLARGQVGQWVRPSLAPVADVPVVDLASETAKLQSQLIELANRKRVIHFQTELKPAATLAEALAKQGGFPYNHDELRASLNRISTWAPHFFSLQARTAQSHSLAGLYDLLASCDALHQDDLDSLALKLYHHPEAGRWDAFMMVAQAAQSFSPKALNEGKVSVLITQCPNCKMTVPIRAFKHQGPCNLICPHCEANYSMLVTDNQGDYHFVNDFLIGFHPPALFPPSQTKLDEMRTIWQGVWNSTDYTRDDRGDTSLGRDAWQTGAETLMRGGGDCDDLSILLADWLIARGFEARVALGDWDGEPHAWVVVLLEQKTYILEATAEPPASAGEIATAATVAARYIPEMMFDREACYYWPDKNLRFNGAYWSTKWQRLLQGQGEHRRPDPNLQLAHALHHKSSAKQGVLRKLQAVETGSDIWQIQWPEVR
jgi:hypothetical protein